MDPQDSLFDAGAPPAVESVPAADAPLAERLRPRTLDEVIGQRHLLDPGRPLRAAFQSGRLHSMILWGPPGVGKTTLARLVAGAFEAQFIVLSAVLSGVKDIREAVEQARLPLGQRLRPDVDHGEQAEVVDQVAGELPIAVQRRALHLMASHRLEPPVGQLGHRGRAGEPARRQRPATEHGQNLGPLRLCLGPSGR